MKIDYEARALALVGQRFRAQGRGEGGLDCVGVVLATFGIPVEAVARDYALRGDHTRELRSQLHEHFRRVPAPQLRAGDVMLLRISPTQLHLAVRTARGFVHAHATIRRVVETPGTPPWEMLGVYRKRRSA